MSQPWLRIDERPAEVPPDAQPAAVVAIWAYTDERGHETTGGFLAPHPLVMTWDSATRADYLTRIGEILVSMGQALIDGDNIVAAVDRLDQA